MVEQHVFMICKALGSTYSTKTVSKFCLIFKEKILLFSVKTLVVPSDSWIRYSFLPSFLFIKFSFDFIPDTMVSAKNPLVNNNKRLPDLILGLAGD